MNYIAHTIFETTKDVNSSVGIFCGMIVNKNLTGLW